MCGLCSGPGIRVEAGLSSPAPPALSGQPGAPWLFPSTWQHRAVCGEPANHLLLLLRVESMSLADRGNPGNITSRLVEKEKARDCLIPMG